MSLPSLATVLGQLPKEVQLASAEIPFVKGFGCGTQAQRTLGTFMLEAEIFYKRHDDRYRGAPELIHRFQSLKVHIVG